jgi:hypothetical protein
MIGELLGFKLGEVHSSEFNLVRTEKGLSSKELYSKFKDTTQKIDNSDITLWYDTLLQNRNFSIQTAFIELTEAQLSQLKIIWNKDKLYPLIFDESPYKYYMVKVDKLTTMKHLAFEKENERYYNGEITFTFIAYFPYSISCFETVEQAREILPIELQGFWENLEYLPITQPMWRWDVQSNIFSVDIYNYGDEPALFKLWFDIVIPQSEGAGGTVILEKLINFDVTITGTYESAAESANKVLKIKGLQKIAKSNDQKVCLDFYRGTLSGYTENPLKPTKNLYNGTLMGDFIELPPKQTTTIKLTDLVGKVYDGNGNEINSYIITFNDINPQYEISYIYRD